MRRGEAFRAPVKAYLTQRRDDATPMQDTAIIAQPTADGLIGPRQRRSGVTRVAWRYMFAFVGQPCRLPPHEHHRPNSLWTPKHLSLAVSLRKQATSLLHEEAAFAVRWSYLGTDFWPHLAAEGEGEEADPSMVR